ncbi:conserved hypothetical protein [Formosa agariphila KMM 3901]|uniref:Peptidase E n=1 Tax=Formosa agariphila (strain DSM 15362 / KCTC 12365 / LMG 23005 / KMM 3901 / M-2Alg 35-1) TaxID=1347342 RepID=T2KPX0_FORAG|nr:DUF6702 family protein [Formosa agariphila]CDF80506.1 conserved hypothetical protein [Formosa agariphila KMM 3901]
MKIPKYYLLLVLIPLLAFTSAHKYYVSISEIQYVKEQQSVQIISRIFIDDLEKLVRQRYDESITLAIKNESEKVDFYLEKYFKEKFHIQINGTAVQLKFIGKEYDNDIAICYIEIPRIETISEFEITNKLLFDVFEEQQNVVRLDINDTQKSFILTYHNDTGVLKLD